MCLKYLYNICIKKFIFGFMENKKDATQKEKFTTNILLSNIPVDTKIKIDAIADAKGITTTAYLKGVIHKAISEEKK